MKTSWKKISIATVVGLLVAVVGAPVKAGCPGSQLLDATFQYLVSNPNWGGAGGSATCGGGPPLAGFGCYASESGPPVSSAMKGVYWAVGSGNPAIGLGNDNGNFRGGFAAGDFWIKQKNGTFVGGVYHYPAWISLNLGDNNVVGPPVTWSSPDADGCGPANPPASVCTCMLITDEWAGAGYFATLCAASNPLGNTRFDTGGGSAFVLKPIPRPLITSSVRDTLSGDVTLSVGAGNAGIPDSAAEGVYTSDSCGTGLQGFRVFGAVVPRGGSPTPGQFVELPRADGSPQGNTGYGAQVAVKADCNPASEQDLFLAVQMVGEGATPFKSGVLSQPSGRVPCGSNLATPGRGDRGEDPRPDRGRDQRR